MKKILLSILIIALPTIGMMAQEREEKPYKREGRTFVEKESTLMRGDRITAFMWRDKSGTEYPIILHTYAKGEKAGRTTAYVVRTSKKSGKEYKYFLPDGEQIASEILAESK